MLGQRGRHNRTTSDSDPELESLLGTPSVPQRPQQADSTPRVAPESSAFQAPNPPDATGGTTGMHRNQSMVDLLSPQDTSPSRKTKGSKLRRSSTIADFGRSSQRGTTTNGVSNAWSVTGRGSVSPIAVHYRSVRQCSYANNLAVAGSGSNSVSPSSPKTPMRIRIPSVPSSSPGSSPGSAAQLLSPTSNSSRDDATPTDPLIGARSHNERVAEIAGKYGNDLYAYYEKHYKTPWWISWLRHFIGLITDRGISTFVFLFGLVSVAGGDFTTLFNQYPVFFMFVAVTLTMLTCLQQWYIYRKHRQMEKDQLNAELDILYNLELLDELKGRPKKTKEEYLRIMRQKFDREILTNAPIYYSSWSYALVAKWKYFRSYEWMAWFKRTWSQILRAFFLIILLYKLSPPVAVYFAAGAVLFTFMWLATHFLYENKQKKYDAMDALKTVREDSYNEVSEAELEVFKRYLENGYDPQGEQVNEQDLVDYKASIERANGADAPWTYLHLFLSFLTIMLSTGIGSVFLKAVTVAITPFNIPFQPIFFATLGIATLMAYMEFSKSKKDIFKLDAKSKACSGVRPAIHQLDTLEKQAAYNQLLNCSQVMGIHAATDAEVKPAVMQFVSTEQMFNKFGKKGIYKTVKMMVVEETLRELGYIPTLFGQDWVVPIAAFTIFLAITTAEYFVKTGNKAKVNTEKHHQQLRTFNSKMVDTVNDHFDNGQNPPDSKVNFKPGTYAHRSFVGQTPHQRDRHHQVSTVLAPGFSRRS